MTASRFRDDGGFLSGYAGEVLAVCPSCGGCARVTRTRGVCSGCAWTKDTDGRTTTWGGAVDPYLFLPLWLTAQVGDEVLWAFNAGHLDVLERYVAAGLRERRSERGWPSMVEKLPPWLKSAKNRDAVLAAVARLRARLEEAT